MTTPSTGRPVDWSRWQTRCEIFLASQLAAADPAHDLAHIRRVVATAERLAHDEGARLDIVRPAAWLHDCVSVSKTSAARSQASSAAAREAHRFLDSEGYPAELLESICHAIEAHSFSAAITPETLEARVVQDADRLDALGAIGIARCLLVGGHLGNTLYHPEQPFPGRPPAQRPADDSTYVLDHFFTKLLKLPDTFQTPAGRREAHRRAEVMRSYLAELGQEIASPTVL